MIGIFDSGSGGLTVLKAIREQMPSADVVYFGDIKNAPYGEKSSAELLALTTRAIGFLRKQGATSIVSACNSVSASLAVSIFDALDIAPEHLIEMVGPTVNAFKGGSGRLVLTATPATVRSDIYQAGFSMIGRNIEAIEIPELAGAIEFGKPEEELERIVRDAFANTPLKSGDTLILACTHYPLVRTVFKRVFPEVTLFDPAEAVARRVKKQFWPREVGDSKTHFIISKESSDFRNRAAALIPGGEFSIEVVD